MEENNFKNRLKEFLAYLKIGQGKFETNCSISNGTVNNIKDGISTPNLERIVTTYPELNVIWLLTGRGEMLVTQKPEQSSITVSEITTWHNYVTPILKEVSTLSEEVGRLKAELSAVQKKKVVQMEGSAEVADAK